MRSHLPANSFSRSLESLTHSQGLLSEADAAHRNRSHLRDLGVYSGCSADETGRSDELSFHESSHIEFSQALILARRG